MEEKRMSTRLLAIGIAAALAAALTGSDAGFAQQAASATSTAGATKMGAVAGYGLRAFEFDTMDPGMADAMCSGHIEMASMSGMGSMADMGSMSMGGMGNMEKHMAWSKLRPASDADRARAQNLVDTLKTALAKYRDYHVAEQDGFKPFHPELKQAEVHFTKNWYAIKAAFVFNPSQPTSLLYRPTPDGGYELVGAMYTAPKRDTEDQLDKRVPLSVAQWHRHISLCFPKKGTELSKADWTKFGPKGAIATKADCDAAGGRFYPQLFGWMVHVYPWEADPSKVWAHAM
jgi:hypothetical protein